MDYNILNVQGLNITTEHLQNLADPEIWTIIYYKSVARTWPNDVVFLCQMWTDTFKILSSSGGFLQIVTYLKSADNNRGKAQEVLGPAEIS